MNTGKLLGWCVAIVFASHSFTLFGDDNRVVSDSTKSRVIDIDLDFFPKAIEEELGNFEPGKQYRLFLNLHIKTGRSQTVASLETSCGCMQSKEEKSDPISNKTTSKVC